MRDRKKTERQIQQSILLRLGGSLHVRLFRNNVGLGFTKTGTPIRFGLRPGSADLIGWKSVTITPEMVGRSVAVFASVETKTEHGSIKPEQSNWLRQVQAAGGIAVIARSVEDAISAVDKF